MRADAWISNVAETWREPLVVRETPAEYVVHRPRLYLETTIPSYLTARVSRNLSVARHQKITHDWWNSWRTNFAIHVSEDVYKEVRAGNPEAANLRLELIRPFPILRPNERSEKLAARLVAACRLPDRVAADAAHVAVAAVHSMQFLLTWNCAHLANPQLAPKMAIACESEGFSCPTLCTPEHLLARYEHERA